MRSDLISDLRERRAINAHGLGTALADPLSFEAADALEEAQRVQEIAIRALGHISATCFDGHVKRPGDHARKALAEIGHDNVERIVAGRP